MCKGEAPAAARDVYVEERRVASRHAMGDSSARGGRGPVELGEAIEWAKRGVVLAGSWNE
jgi:hypothetical protein